MSSSISKFLSPLAAHSRAVCALILALAPLSPRQTAHAHGNKAAAVDEFCSAIRHEFVEAAPSYFSGPNPWVALGALPDEYPDAALAIIYSEGSRVVWLILQMSGPGNAWFETTSYFFDETGLIRKRERHFEQADANVVIAEDTYFEKGKVFKTTYHHGALRGGEEDWDNLSDPHAPDYSSTGDLPITILPTEFKELTLIGNLTGFRRG